MTPPTARFPLRLIWFVLKEEVDVEPATVMFPPTYVLPRASTENLSVAVAPEDK